MPFEFSRYKINGCSLPPLLISLLKTGQWKLPGDVQPLRQITGVRHPEDYSFLDIPEIVTETGSLFRIFEEGQGELYGLASSRRSGRAITEEHLLDIDRAVMIALDSSDHAICLDFRASETSPSVVLADKEEDSIVWRTIAEDFETFVNRLGL